MNEWNIPNIGNKEIFTNISKITGIPKSVVQILYNRNIKKPEEMIQFLNPNWSYLHPSYLLPNIEKGAQRIYEAIKNNEKILIYGDFDADGVISTSILYMSLKKIHDNVLWYIPDRFKEGYGINISGIDYAEEKEVSLIITVDTGITAIEETEIIKAKGMDIIITDHHTPGKELPKAFAIINPKLSHSQYPFKEISGSAVAFKLAQYLESEYFSEIESEEFIDLVGIATIADIMPLIDENRIFVKYALEEINSNPRPGIEELKRVSGIKKEIDETKIAYILAPRLNAAGRMGSAHTAFDLITSDNLKEARALARNLERKNRERQTINQRVYKEVINIIEDNNMQDDPVIVVHSEEWHEGVIGIVASKIVSKYKKPAVIISTKDGKGKGSARSIGGFDIFSSMEKIKDIMIAFGGHKFATGFTIKEEHIEYLKDHLHKEINETQISNDAIDIDAIVEEEDLNWHTYRMIEQMKPFGFGNKKPVLLWQNVPIKGYPRIYKDKHLSFNAGKNNINVIGFNMAEKEEIIMKSNFTVDIVFYIDKNDLYKEKVQLKLIDLKPSYGD